jgi:hypothetical protein
LIDPACANAALTAAAGNGDDGRVGADGPPQLANETSTATAVPDNRHRRLGSDDLAIGRHRF